jgi:ribonuclease HI
MATATTDTKTVGAQVKEIYTDGACSGNPGPGGWGTRIEFADGQIHELGGRDGQTTNNRMEMQAAIAALEYLSEADIERGPVILHTDSEYLKNGVTKWIKGWKRKGWKTSAGKAVLNQDLWEQLDQLTQALAASKFAIDWRYVRGHAGNPGNERCDEIARAFCRQSAIALKQYKAAAQKAAQTAAPHNAVNESTKTDSAVVDSMLSASKALRNQVAAQKAAEQSGEKFQTDSLQENFIESTQTLSAPVHAAQSTSMTASQSNKIYPESQHRDVPLSILETNTANTQESSPIPALESYESHLHEGQQPVMTSASERQDSASEFNRIERLENALKTLQVTDELAQKGYLITSAELADLMDVNASAVTSRGDYWAWRNWTVSRIRREGNQILWQLERIDE